MNIIDLQDNLKNLPENALMKEMQQPTGSAPPFLILGELKRRKQMRDDYNRQQNSDMKTVAEETVTAAGMPQEGIMQASRSLTPKTNMAQDTGIAQAMPVQPTQAPQPQAPQMMSGGGIMRLAEAGKLLNPREVRDSPRLSESLVPSSPIAFVGGRPFYLSEDGQFVVDEGGNKVTEPSILSNIRESMASQTEARLSETPTIGDGGDGGYIPTNIGPTELNTPAMRNALSTDSGAGLATGLRYAAGARQGTDGTSEAERAMKGDFLFSDKTGVSRDGRTNEEILAQAKAAMAMFGQEGRDEAGNLLPVAGESAASFAAAAALQATPSGSDGSISFSDLERANLALEASEDGRIQELLSPEVVPSPKISDVIKPGFLSNTGVPRTQQPMINTLDELLTASQTGVPGQMSTDQRFVAPYNPGSTVLDYNPRDIIEMGAQLTSEEIANTANLGERQLKEQRIADLEAVAETPAEFARLQKMKEQLDSLGGPIATQSQTAQLTSAQDIFSTGIMDQKKDIEMARANRELRSAQDSVNQLQQSLATASGISRPIIERRLAEEEAKLVAAQEGLATTTNTVETSPDLNDMLMTTVGDGRQSIVSSNGQRIRTDNDGAEVVPSATSSQMSPDQRFDTAAAAENVSNDNLIETSEAERRREAAEDRGGIAAFKPVPPAGGGDTDVSTSSTSGAYGSIESRIAKMLSDRESSAESDKWLALAQTGMALMSSKNPTFGGALGEAGLAGVGALQKSRKAYDSDIMGLLGMQQKIQSAKSLDASRAAKSTTGGSKELNTMIDNAQASLNGLMTEARSYRKVVAADPTDPTSLDRVVEQLPQKLIGDIDTARERLDTLQRIAIGSGGTQFDATQ